MKPFPLQGLSVQILTLGILLFMFPALPVAAVEPALNLQPLIEEAFQRNPEIQAAKQRWKAAKARIPQVQTLPDPIFFW